MTKQEVRAAALGKLAVGPEDVCWDIGAGTGDIAVCRDGSVVGYTMATTAGDEITEELMRRYLIPFQTA